MIVFVARHGRLGPPLSTDISHGGMEETWGLEPMAGKLRASVASVPHERPYAGDGPCDGACIPGGGALLKDFASALPTSMTISLNVGA